LHNNMTLSFISTFWWK